jgi:hypothetical protein
VVGETSTIKTDKVDEHAAPTRIERAAAEVALTLPQPENQSGVMARRGRFIPSP